jgi:succinate dehydrogenase hydrophobic anchor subunit
MARYMTRREEGLKRAWWRALSGLADFFAMIGSAVIIILCVTLLTTLFTWLRSDITQTLSTLESVAVSAIVQPQSMGGD